MPDEKSPPAIPESQDSEEEEAKEDYRAVLRKKARGSKRISWLLDECFKIPFFNIRFGLDPIIGILPFGGEAIASLIGAVVLGEAGKKGIPFKSLLRMGGNMIVNAGVGSLPVLGDAFSVWFKSNSRNYKMLSEFLESEEGQEADGGWWPVIVIILIVGVVLAINVGAFLIYLKILTMLMGLLHLPAPGGAA